MLSYLDMHAPQLMGCGPQMPSFVQIEKRGMGIWLLSKLSIRPPARLTRRVVRLMSKEKGVGLGILSKLSVRPPASLTQRVVRLMNKYR
jgi:hypothetical protein